MTARRPGAIAGAFAAAAVSFGVLVMSFSPLAALGWVLPISSFVASAAWLVLAVIAVRRYGRRGAWTLLAAPFALISPLLFLGLGVWCDWGRNACM
jgi:hypothetical protein